MPKQAPREWVEDWFADADIDDMSTVDLAAKFLRQLDLAGYVILPRNCNPEKTK